MKMHALTHAFIINFVDMAKEILKENREHLDELAMNTTNSTVNDCFKWIDVWARRNERTAAVSTCKLF